MRTAPASFQCWARPGMQFVDYHPGADGANSRPMCWNWQPRMGISVTSRRRALRSLAPASAALWVHAALIRAESHTMSESAAAGGVDARGEDSPCRSGMRGGGSRNPPRAGAPLGHNAAMPGTRRFLALTILIADLRGTLLGAELEPPARRRYSQQEAAMPVRRKTRCDAGEAVRLWCSWSDIAQGHDRGVCGATHSARPCRVA